MFQKGDRVLFHGGYGDCSFTMPGVIDDRRMFDPEGNIDLSFWGLRLESGSYHYAREEQLEKI